MKNCKNEKNQTLMKRISFCISLIIIFQIMIPVIGNIDIIPSSYSKDLTIIDNITYTIAGTGSGVIAEIRDKNIENITIKSEIEIGGRKERVGTYRIEIDGYSGTEFKNLNSLKKLTIPVRMLRRSALNDYIFANANSIEEIELIGNDELTEDVASLKKLKN